MTGLVIGVGIVVPGTFFGDKFGMQNVAAVGCPVFYAKDVVVVNYSMNDEERPRVEELVFHRNGENDRFSMLLSMPYGLETLYQFAIREDGSGSNRVVGMARGISKVQTLPFFEYADYDVAMNILRWGLSCVHELRRDKDRFIDGEIKITFNEFESHPRALIPCEIDVGIVPLTIVHPGIEDSSDYSNNLKHRFPPWTLMVAAIMGLIGIAFGWIGLRRERHTLVSFIAFLAGVCLWGYAVIKALPWTLRF